MSTIQPIYHRGRLAALVAGEHAILAEGLVRVEQRAVKAKCLYALQIHTGERPAPYTDAAAERYARSAAVAHDNGGRTSRRRRLGPPKGT
jgi:hypothetical protein